MFGSWRYQELMAQSREVARALSNLGAQVRELAYQVRLLRRELGWADDKLRTQVLPRPSQAPPRWVPGKGYLREPEE